LRRKISTNDLCASLEIRRFSACFESLIDHQRCWALTLSVIIKLSDGLSKLFRRVELVHLIGDGSRVGCQTVDVDSWECEEDQHLKM
jgi:hypothetical protein